MARTARTLFVAVLALVMLAGLPGVASAANVTKGVFSTSTQQTVQFGSGDKMSVGINTPAWVEGMGNVTWNQARSQVKVGKTRGAVAQSISCPWYKAYKCTYKVTKVYVYTK